MDRVHFRALPSGDFRGEDVEGKSEVKSQVLGGIEMAQKPEVRDRGLGSQVPESMVDFGDIGSWGDPIPFVRPPIGRRMLVGVPGRQIEPLLSEEGRRQGEGVLNGAVEIAQHVVGDSAALGGHDQRPAKEFIVIVLGIPIDVGDVKTRVIGEVPKGDEDFVPAPRTEQVDDVFVSVHGVGGDDLWLLGENGNTPRLARGGGLAVGLDPMALWDNVR